MEEFHRLKEHQERKYILSPKKSSSPRLERVRLGAYVFGDHENCKDKVGETGRREPQRDRECRLLFGGGRLGVLCS